MSLLDGFESLADGFFSILSFGAMEPRSRYDSKSFRKRMRKIRRELQDDTAAMRSDWDAIFRDMDAAVGKTR